MSDLTKFKIRPSRNITTHSELTLKLKCLNAFTLAWGSRYQYPIMLCNRLLIPSDDITLKCQKQVFSFCNTWSDNCAAKWFNGKNLSSSTQPLKWWIRLWILNTMIEKNAITTLGRETSYQYQSFTSLGNVNWDVGYSECSRKISLSSC